jgi:hypothetical protein
MRRRYASCGLEPRDDLLRQAAGAGDRDGVAALPVGDRRVGAGLDQERESLPALQARGVEERRLAMGDEVQARLRRKERAEQDGVVAPHRRPQARAGIGAAGEEEAHEREVLAARGRVPHRRGAEVALVGVHRHARLDVGAGGEERRRGLGAVGLGESRRAGLHRAGKMQRHAAARIGRRHESRRGGEDRADGGGLPALRGLE